ncbi:hypothetical protein [Chloroherpeton thalassium]|uniref:hypothetical protein n=1 Tax=Chloroherpeton thalassium TaxID=100716 RepID=UPI0012FC4E89|nr:hypothetical protein [Chloroherpeton thalassium]
MKLFLIDLTDRIKFERKHKRTESANVIIHFLEELSEAEEPVRFLEKLDLPTLSDFQTFLSSSLSNIDKDFQEGKGTNTYQVLTENIESTAEYLNSVLSDLSHYPTLLEKLDRFLQGNPVIDFSSDLLSPLSEETADTENQQAASFSEEESEPKEKVKAFPTGDLDYGFDLNELFFEPEEHTPAKESLDDDQRFFQKLLAELRATILLNKNSEITYQVIQKLSENDDVLAEFEKLKVIPGFESFINFYFEL